MLLLLLLQLLLLLLLQPLVVDGLVHPSEGLGKHELSHFVFGTFVKNCFNCELFDCSEQTDSCLAAAFLFLYYTLEICACVEPLEDLDFVGQEIRAKLVMETGADWISGLVGPQFLCITYLGVSKKKL